MFCEGKYKRRCNLKRSLYITDKGRRSENSVYIPLRVPVLPSRSTFRADMLSGRDALRLDRSVTDSGTCREVLAVTRVALVFQLDWCHPVRLLHLIIRLLLQLLENIARIVDRRTINPTRDNSRLAISIENCLDHRVAITCRRLFELRTKIRLCHTCNFWCQNKGEVLASPIQHAKSRETANTLVRCLLCHVGTSDLDFAEILTELYCARRSST